VITHTYTEGTVLTGTLRSDDLYRLLRSHGWLYRRSAGDYRLQASQDRPAKTGPIGRTAGALRERGFTVTVHLGSSRDTCNCGNESILKDAELRKCSLARGFGPLVSCHGPARGS
jgi:hypothetical protein